jgi:hypothetical protein
MGLRIEGGISAAGDGAACAVDSLGSHMDSRDIMAELPRRVAQAHDHALAVA